jgi:propanediol dehydratase small subunit
MKPKACIVGLAAILTAVTVGTAQAKISDTVVTPPPVVLETANEGAQVLSDEALGELRGGQALTLSNQTLNAISTGSVLNGDYTAGAINLTDNALSNFNGFGNVVINTGAQNNLQAGMNITINLAN